jgi:fluoride exporter
MTAVYIGLAGAMGAILRFLLSLAMNPNTVLTIPWGTLAVNLAGCFIISTLLSSERLAARLRLRTILTTGLIGSFTTMSTLSLELFVLLEHERWVFAALYFTLSLVGGLAMIRWGKSIKLLS